MGSWGYTVIVLLLIHCNKVVSPSQGNECPRPLSTCKVGVGDTSFAISISTKGACLFTLDLLHVDGKQGNDKGIIFPIH